MRLRGRATQAGGQDEEMTIVVELLATFSRYLPPGSRDRRCALTVPEGTTVSALLSRLGLPSDDAKIILRNGTHISGDCPLVEGDVVSVFPPLAGGTG